MTARRHILVIEDDLELAEFIAHVAAGLGNECTIASDPERALLLLRPDTALIFLDLKMPGKDGVQLLRSLAEGGQKQHVVLMTGLSKRLLEATETLALELGITISGVLKKPFSLRALEQALAVTSEVHKPFQPALVVGMAPDDAELIAAIDTNQFILHYQPQVDVVSCQVVGFEALVRWNHPERGLVFPDAFLPSLESLKLMDRLGSLVANTGFSDAARLAEMARVPVTLSINVSPTSLASLTLPDTLAELAEARGVCTENIIIEVTESALIQDLSRTLEVLIRLRMKGFQISIDDFGTGYAMMEHLRNIPATELKIDRSFVKEMHANSSDRIAVEKTIEIGHELGMTVIAEGVESELQLRFLQKLRCDVAQGYLFSRPLALKQLGLWLTQHNAEDYGRLAS